VNKKIAGDSRNSHSDRAYIRVHYASEKITDEKSVRRKLMKLYVDPNWNPEIALNLVSPILYYVNRSFYCYVKYSNTNMVMFETLRVLHSLAARKEQIFKPSFINDK
jgi:hypothetical protein